jgi:hypothetical protein
MLLTNAVVTFCNKFVMAVSENQGQEACKPVKIMFGKYCISFGL